MTNEQPSSSDWQLWTWIGGVIFAVNCSILVLTYLWMQSFTWANTTVLMRTLSMAAPAISAILSPVATGVLFAKRKDGNALIRIRPILVALCVITFMDVAWLLFIALISLVNGDT